MEYCAAMKPELYAIIRTHFINIMWSKRSQTKEDLHNVTSFLCRSKVGRIKLILRMKLQRRQGYAAFGREKGLPWDRGSQGPCDHWGF